MFHWNVIRTELLLEKFEMKQEIQCLKSRNELLNVDDPLLFLRLRFDKNPRQVRFELHEI